MATTIGRTGYSGREPIFLTQVKNAGRKYGKTQNDAITDIFSPAAIFRRYPCALFDVSSYVLPVSCRDVSWIRTSDLHINSTSAEEVWCDFEPC